ncbi:MAG: hypothetical protein HKO59_11515 [Phycisphaerales bacterium]|nr:hypothetical protein [Phycisphaerae bacterium]NNF43831.1 hypothetical protein [Phycisphaerales bacterium]NNM26591.1 hypothetical protein [Phycisphaerales bacterium]
MISRIEGKLVAVGEGRAQVETSVLTVELFVPAADEQRLHARLGETLDFHTLCYLEGQGQGNTFIPRLIGFTSGSERAFFELFTTVKGLGNRRALRALALPFDTIAQAIAARDVDILKSLPEVGPRTAETIVAELHGKVDRFVEVKPLDGELPDGVGVSQSGLARDAVAMLTQLGESAVAARQLVTRVINADPAIDTPEDLVAAAYRLKELT